MTGLTGVFGLDWAIMAVSLFNTILMLWLGMTVLLNAERRPTGERPSPARAQFAGWRWGVLFAGGGLLLGGAFFFSHSAILGHNLSHATPGMDFWWRVGWLPVLVLPFAWYGVMLWYAGFWDDRQARLYRRQRPWFVFSAALTVGLVSLLAWANPLPTYGQIMRLELGASPAVGGMPLLILAYPLYIVLCIGLSLDALRRPGPTERVMGDLARRRAHPWLTAASIVLLLVSLLVAGVMIWIVFNVRQYGLYGLDEVLSYTIAWFDLVIAALIAVVVILLGQAVTAYEVFTGKTLPRRGFRRYWLNAVILAAGYSLVTSWSLTIQLRPIYLLLLAALLITVFYALLVWRSFDERERTIQYLRPFVTSQRLYERMLSQAAPFDHEAAAWFRALCSEVLGARLAYLVALGPLAALVRPVVYPDESVAGPPALSNLAARFDGLQAECLPLDPALYGGATWAVPLWSERGLVGALLLGEKRDGALYTQEEIEIARASGERLVDVQAGAEMARRLMTLQRQRLAESQVLDQRARRSLHDEVLPRLHAAMLTLSGVGGESDPAFAEGMALLTDVHRQISDLLHDIPSPPAIPQAARLGLVEALRQVIEGELQGAFDDVTWQVRPEAECAARALPALAAEVIFGAARETLRNAARHGRGDKPDRPLKIRIALAWRDELELMIEDNGVGLDVGDAGQADDGHGLALHSTLMAVIGGMLLLESAPGMYTRVRLRAPAGENQPVLTTEDTKEV